MISLGIAAEVGRLMGPVTALARAEKLPIKFLQQILSQLRLGGFVKSARGKCGGYHLSKSANTIIVGQGVHFIEGPLALIGGVSQSAYAPWRCPDEAQGGLRMVMLDVRNTIAGILDRYTLAAVAEIITRKMIKSGRPLPCSGWAPPNDPSNNSFIFDRPFRLTAAHP
ncbi:MAG: Rrf2 family transcriptional regulator, partial [Opitutaceae bacterium]